VHDGGACHLVAEGERDPVIVVPDDVVVPDQGRHVAACDGLDADADGPIAYGNDGAAQAAPPTKPPPVGTAFEAAPFPAVMMFLPWMKATTAALSLLAPP
jgi:hypothetical protein